MNRKIHVCIFIFILTILAFDRLFADEKPVAHYTFENGFIDESGNSLDGTPFGDAVIMYNSERESNVLKLDGNGDYVDLGNDPLFDWTGAFTVAFWVKVNQWQVNWDTILKKSGAWSVERHMDQQALAFYHWPDFVPTTVALSDEDDWHHITATYDGVLQRIYRDGVLLSSAGNIGDMNVNSNHVIIGSADGTGRFFNGLLDDVRFYDRILTAIEIDSLGGSMVPFTGEITHLTEIEGNYELNVEVIQGNESDPFRILFSGNAFGTMYAYLEIAGNSFRVGRELTGITDIWKTVSDIGEPPWKIRILKKGNYYRFWVNDATGWIRGPLGEWEHIYEPRNSFVGMLTSDSVIVQSFTVTTLPWLQQINQPVIPRGPAGSFYESQAIPGAIIEYDNQYYMYFMAGKTGTQEGATERTIGVAVSSDLYDWVVQPNPILSYEEFGDLGDNIYPSGAVITPDGKIALMYAVQKFPVWQGFFLATADHPLGPFENYGGNPVYKHFTHAHEFDLVRVDEPGRRYILLYAGFTPNPPYGPDGDRGYALYSDDLVNWDEDPQNPVFGPETLDNWDAIHIRPRSLNKIGTTYYLWYEGVNSWPSPNPNWVPWWDTIGLARSPDLQNWEYYPRNPALPALGIGMNQFDKDWVGWPRMVVKNDTGYVFYTGGGETGLRTIAVDRLVNWESEGGIFTGVDDNDRTSSNDSGPGDHFILHQNHPNPFNPSTTISFTLYQKSEVKLSIYNSVGQRIFSFTNKYSYPGKYDVVWNGTDQFGLRIGSGLYLCELITENQRKINKVICIR